MATHLTYGQLMDMLKRGIDEPNALVIDKFPIQSLSLSRSTMLQLMQELHAYRRKHVAKGPIEIVYNTKTGQFITRIHDYYTIIEYGIKKQKFVPAKIWSVEYSDYHSNVYENDLYFTPVPLNSFPQKVSIIKETYHDRQSDDEKTKNAELYFSIGQEGPNSVTDKNYCWIWDGNNVISKMGATHGLNFSHQIADRNFKGWYDVAKNIISVVFPEHELRKLGDRRPTEDDIPQYLYQKLMEKFGRRKPRIVVFESKNNCISKKDLKLLLKEIVRQVFEVDEGKKDKLLQESFLKLNEKLLQESLFTGKKWWKWSKWWIGPEGKIYNVIDELSHAEWAKQYIIKTFGEIHPYTKAIEKNYNTIYDILYGSGWVRVSFFSQKKLLYFAYQNNRPNSEIMSILKDMAKRLNARLIDQTTEQAISLNEIKLEPILDETMTYKELLGLTTDDRKERAANVNVRSIPVSVEEGQEQWNFRYKSSPQTTVTDEPFEGHIIFLKGEVEQGDNAMDLECKVDCSCPDFMYRFAYNDTQKGASDIGPDSLSGCINRGPKPAYDFGEGLCKHLAALSRYLRTKITATKKSNLFEAIGEVAKQGPFNITYYD